VRGSPRSLAFLRFSMSLWLFGNRLWRTQHPAPVILGGPGSGLNPTMGKVLPCAQLLTRGHDPPSPRSLSP